MHGMEHAVGEWVEKAHVIVEIFEDVSKTCTAVFLGLLAARILGQFLGVW